MFRSSGDTPPAFNKLRDFAPAQPARRFTDLVPEADAQFLAGADDIGIQRHGV
jgi:hypothetical protein